MKHSRIALTAWALLPALVGCRSTAALWSGDESPPVPDYPPTDMRAVVDTHHGVEVPDPYRWLEQDVRTSDEVSAWVEAQNEVTFAYLRALPGRERLTELLESLWDYERVTLPVRHGDRYYFWCNDGLQPQAVLLASAEPFGQAEVVLDPNTWSEDGTKAFAAGEWSQDGRYLAYGVSDAGSDWSTWQVLDLQTGEHVGGVLEWIKFSGVAWLPDGTGFFYSRYEEPADGQEFQAANRDQKVAFHRLHSEQTEDHVFYRRPDHPDWSFSPVVSEDGRWLVIHVWESGNQNLVHLFDMEDHRARLLEVVDEWVGSHSFVGSRGDRLFFFVLDEETPKGRVDALDVAPDGRWLWSTVIPEGEDVIEEVTHVGDRLVVRWMADASSRVSIHDMGGGHERAVELPGLGSAEGFEHKPFRTETFYRFSSFDTPPSVFRYDVASGESELLRSPEVPFDPADYTVEQVFFESEDGTRVPMFLTYKNGLERDGENPTLLYGYGGFNISLTPYYSPNVMAWIELGGLYAVPNLRGGGEYGKQWHTAGTKTTKQTTFDDFVAAAEYLIDEGYTTPHKLAIQGGSNGGLLVGAVMCQRPELFGCCLPAVGVMDMLRFHLFTAGRFWVYDYGSVDDPDEFAALHAYSPYHNLVDGTCYPPTLVTTADTDDRVVPGHSFKFAARLQAAQGCDNPTLIRIETSAGHGAGKPTTKRVEEAVDVWAFAAKALGMGIGN